MKKDKFRLAIIGAFTFLLLGTIALYSTKTIFNEKISLSSLLVLIIPLIIIVLMVFFLLRRTKDIRQGMPLEDERSRKVKTNAAATSFYISLYWFLAISWFEPYIVETFGVKKPDTSAVIGLGIGGMALIFFICWFYYEKKGKLV